MIKLSKTDMLYRLKSLDNDEDELKANIMNDKDYFFFFENYKDYVRRFKT